MSNPLRNPVGLSWGFFFFNLLKHLCLLKYFVIIIGERRIMAIP
jgi:hypothetical protein